jgi:hypothetical protein
LDRLAAFALAIYGDTGIAEKSGHCWMMIGGWLVFWFGWGYLVRAKLVGYGNPVYAFFPRFSAEKYQSGGADILQPGRMAHGQGAAQFCDTLWKKVVNSLVFFQSDWRFAPLLTGIMLPDCCWAGNANSLFLSLRRFYSYSILSTNMSFPDCTGTHHRRVPFWGFCWTILISGRKRFYSEGFLSFIARGCVGSGVFCRDYGTPKCPAPNSLSLAPGDYRGRILSVCRPLWEIRL